MMPVKRRKEALETATDTEVALGMIEICHLDSLLFSLTSRAICRMDQVIYVFFLKGSERTT